MIKLSTCQRTDMFDIKKKTISNFALSFVSENHDYATRSTSLQHQNPDPSK